MCAPSKSTLKYFQCEKFQPAYKDDKGSALIMARMRKDVNEISSACYLRQSERESGTGSPANSRLIVKGEVHGEPALLTVGLNTSL